MYYTHILTGIWIGGATTLVVTYAHDGTETHGRRVAAAIDQAAKDGRRCDAVGTTMHVTRERGDELVGRDQYGTWYGRPAA